MERRLPEPIEQLYSPAAGLFRRPRTDGRYHHRPYRLFAEAAGVGLFMDVFAPEVPANGLGIVDVVSGFWSSGRVRLAEHIGIGLIDELCERGFHVFAVSPGSIGQFTGAQQIHHVHAAIRHVKAHAGEFGLDPARLGLYGSSSGGHLAAMAALQPEAAKPTPRHAFSRFDTSVAACALLFPAVDFVDFGDGPFHAQHQRAPWVERLLFSDAPESRSDATWIEAARKMSPLHQLHPGAPPLYLMHGTEDPIVPVEQAHRFSAAARALGISCELTIKQGGAHPWKDVRNEFRAMAAWLEATLGGRQR